MSYQKLESHPLSPDAPVLWYQKLGQKVVSQDEPAVDVMTDLKYVKVITVDANAGINDALHIMIQAGVRMLVVTNDQGISGIITSRDINGEKPVDFISQHRVTRDEVKVSDIMTPRSQMDALWMSDVREAKVGNIIATLREAGRQHAIVVDDTPIGEVMLRGIFSVTQIGRRMGIDIESTGQVQSFAKLESVLSAGETG